LSPDNALTIRLVMCSLRQSAAGLRLRSLDRLRKPSADPFRQKSPANRRATRHDSPQNLFRSSELKLTSWTTLSLSYCTVWQTTIHLSN
jgi:hypothetical protein